MKILIKGFYKSPIIKATVSAYQKAWDTIGDEYFNRLEKIMKVSLPEKKITAYLTTQYRCPYNYGDWWFMVSFFRSVPHVLKIAGHEIMHLYFHNSHYWPEVEKKVGKAKTEDLKEALTVLLNLEFGDLWQVKDEGKNNEQQQKLREYISEQWKKKKEFEILMKRCVSYLKKNESR